MAALARLWSLREERPLFVVTALAVLGVLLAYPFVDWWLRTAGIAPEFRFWDFGAYWKAVTSWRAGGEIYVPNEGGGYHGSYLYPPVSLLLFWPFVAALPFRGAAMAWEAVSFVLLWGGLQLVAASLGFDFEWWERGVLAWAMLGFQPLLLSLKMGQTAAFLAAVLCFALVALAYGEREGRPWRLASGGFTALVGAVKLTYAPAGAHLLGDRDRMAGAVATGAGLLAASVLLFGPATHLAYVDVLQWGLGQGTDARSPARWLAPYYRPLAWLPFSLPLRVSLSLVVAAYAALAARGADRAVFALGVAAFPLLAPLTYTYYLVALLPAVLVLLAAELEIDGRPAVPVVGLLLVSLHSYGLKLLVDVLPTVLPAGEALRPVYPLLQPGLWGNALLFGLAAVRVGEAVTLPGRANEGTGVRSDAPSATSAGDGERR